METETRTFKRYRVSVAPGYGGVSVVRLPNGDHGAHVALTITPDELRHVVQQAYDQFGILAEPSIDVEAERYEHDQAQRAAELDRSFADAWGRSIGDRS